MSRTDDLAVYSIEDEIPPVRSNGAAIRPIDEVTPPSDREIEGALIGAVLIAPAILNDCPLRPTDFYDDRHQILFRHMLRLVESGGLDGTLLLLELRESGDLEQAGGFAYLGEIALNAGSPMLAPHYVEAIQRKAAQRRALTAAREIVRQAEKADPQELVDLLRTEADLIDRDTAPSLYERLTMADLDKKRGPIEYDVAGILAARQPAIVAAVSKCMKTSTCCDLSLSLAIGGNFLGRWPVPKARRVYLTSNESGEAVIADTLRRICEAAGVDMPSVENLLFGSVLPKMGSAAHEKALRKFLKAEGVEVLVIDPLYKAMPGGDVENLFITGELVSGVSDICAELGVTLVVVHHCKKRRRDDPYGPSELESIAWAGFGEWARQWILLARREPYQPGTGEHKLWMSVGGSAGHSGMWGLNINEGQYNPNTPRRWDVEVLAAGDVQHATIAERDQGRAKRRAEQLDADRKTVVALLVKRGPSTKTDLRNNVEISKDRFGNAFNTLMTDGSIVPHEIEKTNGHKYEGWAASED